MLFIKTQVKMYFTTKLSIETFKIPAVGNYTSFTENASLL